MEVARLRRRFSFVLQLALSFLTRHHLCRQGVVLARIRHLCSQGPVSVYAHFIEGVTRSEGQEEANGVGAGSESGAGMEAGTGSEAGTGT